MNLKKPSIIVTCIGLVILSWLSAKIYYARQTKSEASLVRINSSQYKYINPLLLIDNSSVEFPEFNTIKNKIADLTRSMKSEGLAKDISVYFRDSNSAKWTGVDEDLLYDPSSMLKVVTLLAYMKIAESDPEILTQKLYLSAKEDPGQFYKPEKKLVAGNYTVRELLVYMIIDSDNESMKILNEYRPDKVLEVFKELSLPTGFSIGQGFMSPELYSRLFRTLYGSTYLSRNFSEEALRLLSLTGYDRGIVSGVGSTTVSHKFGEHTFLYPDGRLKERELHDCGIVYYPGRPYFLCIMTRGDNFENLERVISSLSREIYDEVEKETKN